MSHTPETPTAPARCANTETAGGRCNPSPNREKGSIIITRSTDHALAAEHVKVALGRIYLAVAHLERLVASETDVDAIYNDRAELKRITESLDEIISRWEVDR
jgi:hypothetical protein